MLRKLIKHEFKATYKIFFSLYFIVFALAGLTRLIMFVESSIDSPVFSFISILVYISYGGCCIFVAFFTFAIAIARFYSNMLKDQGYLMHTLPVKKLDLFLSKTIVFTIWSIVSFLAALASIILVYIGTSGYKTVMGQIGDLLSDISQYPSLIAVMILMLLVLILQSSVNLTGYFSAMCLGQQFKKHKILGSIVSFFALNYCISFLVSLVMILIELAGIVGFDMEVSINKYTTRGEVIAAFHDKSGSLLLFTGVLIVLEILLFAIYTAIANYMLNKKLNLE